jgi:hypothetical protein
VTNEDFKVKRQLEERVERQRHSNEAGADMGFEHKQSTVKMPKVENLDHNHFPKSPTARMVKKKLEKE